MILGIDTSADQCAVALVAGARVWKLAETMERGHAEALFPMIQQILDQSSARHGDIERIAVCTGPGSFTGVRVGVSAARGLALGLGVPAVGITRFEALAAQHPDQPEITIPGRGGEIFIQQFGEDRRPAGDPRIEQGHADEALADPVAIARMAADRDASTRPAPLYLRPADADPPRESPPARLD